MRWFHETMQWFCWLAKNMPHHGISLLKLRVHFIFANQQIYAPRLASEGPMLSWLCNYSMLHYGNAITLFNGNIIHHISVTTLCSCNYIKLQ